MYTIRDFEWDALILIILGANASISVEKEGGGIVVMRWVGEMNKSDRRGVGEENVKEMRESWSLLDSTEKKVFDEVVGFGSPSSGRID